MTSEKQSRRDRYQALTRQLGGLRVKKNQPLAAYTTFKVGGPADRLFIARKTEDLVKAVKSAYLNQLPFFVLGSGSNVIISDQGLRGLVIINRCDQIGIVAYGGQKTKTGERGRVVVEAEGGTHLQRLKRWTIEQGLGGLEFVDGIPGTVGAAVKLNVHDRHRPNQERYLSDVLLGATLLTPQGETKEVAKDYLEFDQKRRGWKMGSKLFESGEIVLTARFRLQKTDPETLWAYVREYTAWRRRHQPQGVASSGSFFTNPSAEISAGRLIDQAGLKGKTVGGAAVSKKHANFIVNSGSASAADVVGLASIIKKTVKEKSGIELEEEVFYLGFDEERGDKSD